MGLFKYLINKEVINNIFHNEEAKGRIVEEKVNSVLNSYFFGKTEHRQINNLTIIDDNNKSHQIDHIEIRSNGIFCIETKN